MPSWESDAELLVQTEEQVGGESVSECVLYGWVGVGMWVCGYAGLIVEPAIVMTVGAKRTAAGLQNRLFTRSHHQHFYHNFIISTTHHHHHNHHHRRGGSGPHRGAPQTVPRVPGRHDALASGATTAE